MSVYFVKGKGWRYDFTLKGKQVHGSLVQNKNKGKTSRSKKKGGSEKPETGTKDPNRYGLLDIG